MSQHPDDRFALTDAERDQFRQIWRDLADGEPHRPGAGSAEFDGSHPWPSAAMIVCVVLVFVGLAADSVFLVLVAAGGAVGALAARRRGHS